VREWEQHSLSGIGKQQQTAKFIVVAAKAIGWVGLRGSSPRYLLLSPVAYTESPCDLSPQHNEELFVRAISVVSIRVNNQWTWKKGEAAINRHALLSPSVKREGARYLPFLLEIGPSI
jgi:hypothetical protein